MAMQQTVDAGDEATVRHLAEKYGRRNLMHIVGALDVGEVPAAFAPHYATPDLAKRAWAAHEAAAAEMESEAAPESAVTSPACSLCEVRADRTLLEVPVRDGAIVLNDNMREAARGAASKASRDGATPLGIGVAVALAVLDATPRPVLNSCERADSLARDLDHTQRMVDILRAEADHV